MAFHVTDIQSYYARHRVFLIAGGVAIVPDRGPVFPFRTRMKDAWRVLTGRYDALSWEYLK